MSKTEIEQIKKDIEKLQSELHKKGEKYFREETKAIFASYPEMQSFSWRQYTPYFNDGDACTFSCHGADYVDINQHGANPEQEDDDFEPSADLEEIYLERAPGKKAPWHERAAYEICELIGFVGEDVMLKMFGDHCKVIVGRKKTVVEDYEHE